MGEHAAANTSVNEAIELMDQVASSLFVQNAFWVFVGILAGAVIQFLLHQAVLRQQRGNARRLFRVEIEINKSRLEELKKEIQKKKAIFVAGEQNEGDYFFDMSGFNYRMLDPLINSGHFHDLLGTDGVTDYFRFANDANSDAAARWAQMLHQKSQEGSPVRFLNYLLDTRIPEMRRCLQTVEDKLT